MVLKRKKMRRKNWHRRYTRKHINHDGWHSYPRKRKMKFVEKFLIGLGILAILFFLISLPSLNENNDNISIQENELPVEEESSKPEVREEITNWFSKIGDFMDEKVISNIKQGVNSEERDMASIEEKIFLLVNEERARQGAGQLKSQSHLNSFARAWSEKMIKEDFFEHSNLNFAFPSTAGENIGETPIHYNVVGCGPTYSNNALAECFVSGWIESPGHHENMISREFYMTGIGVSCSGSTCRATQVFAG